MKRMYKRILLAASFCFTVLFANATVWTIQVQEFDFLNNPGTVNVGDTIRWNWLNGDHTTTSTTIPSGAATWDSPMNSSNTQFEYIVTEPGVYIYHCTPHATMMSATFTAIGTTNNVSPTTLGNVFAVKLDGNDRVTITYNVDRIAPVSIGVYDLTGKLLKTIGT